MAGKFLIPRTVLSISLLDLILFFRSSVPGRRSFSCVCSKVLFPRGAVGFTIGLTGWVHMSWFSVPSVICIVCLGFVGFFFVGVKICKTTVIVVVFAGIIRVVLGLVFLFFEFTALVSVVTWLIAVVTIWFGFFWIFLCGLLRHRFYLQFIWRFQTIQFQLFSKMGHNLFICAIFRMRLFNLFSQLGTHFYIYELLHDRLSGNSECIFR